MLFYHTMKNPHEKIHIPPLANTAPLEKLIWLYVAAKGEAEYSSRDLGKQLNADYKGVHASLVTLKSLGLLVETVPGSGRKAAKVKALEPNGLEKLL